MAFDWSDIIVKSIVAISNLMIVIYVNNIRKKQFIYMNKKAWLFLTIGFLLLFLAHAAEVSDEITSEVLKNGFLDNAMEIIKAIFEIMSSIIVLIGLSKFYGYSKLFIIRGKGGSMKNG